MCLFPGVSERSIAAPRGARRRVCTLTLVEVVAVLAALAIMGAVATRALRPAGAALAAEAGMLTSRLRYVQALAMAGGSEQIWGMRVEAERYWLVRDGAAPAGVNLPGAQSGERRFASGVRVSAGAGLVAFDAWGSPGAADVNITLTDGSTSRVVTVSATTGFVR